MNRTSTNQNDKSTNKSYANRSLSDALKPQTQSTSQSKCYIYTYIQNVSFFVIIVTIFQLLFI